MRQSDCVQIDEAWDEGQDCFVIRSADTTFYLQKESGGFSSIMDRDGFDWINFKTTDYGRPGDAGGIFRGLPNLVWPDNIGHPGYRMMRSTQIGDNQIRSVSNDEQWEWVFTFGAACAQMEITRAPADKSYWFLFEGTQGGRYDPSRSFWGTERHGRRVDAVACFGPDEFYDHWKQVYFGFSGVSRVFFATIHTETAPLNLMSYMGTTEDSLNAPDGMTVFGFGRGDGPVPLLTGPATFSFGFLETTDHDEIIAQTANQSI